MNEIDKKIANGAAWMVLFKLIDRGLGLASTIVLARLLLPSDFGLVAMATVLVSALELLVSFSFDVPLIQNRNAGRDQFDTAWSFNLLFAATCGLLLALLAIPASHFYREPRLEAVIYVLAISFAIQGFVNIGTVNFRREMRFDREFKFLLTKRLAGLAISVPLAVCLKSYWALVIGQLAGAILTVMLSYAVSDYRPRFSLSARRELFSTSKWLLMNNIFHFLNGRAAEFVLGRFVGAQTLGIYTIASEISCLPTTELVAPINRAAFPGYARSASNLEQLRKSYLNVISMIALIAIPAGIGIGVVADLFVRAILGPNWLAAIPIMQIMAAYGVIQALQTNIGYVYLAVGKGRLITIIAALQFVLLAGLIVPGVRYGSTLGVAWAFLVSVLVMLPVNQILIARQLQLSGTAFMMSIMRPLSASALMACVLVGIKMSVNIQNDIVSSLFALLISIGVGAITYLVGLYGLWRLASRPTGPEEFCFSKLKGILHKLGVSVNLVRG